MSPKYEVCPQCEGEGKMVNRAVSVWTESDRAEDPDGFRDMMDGLYDVPCDMCRGQRVVSQDDREDFADRRQDHFTRLQESGIYPGSPDYF
jgi:DnaJ-class molecular chaperone